MPSKVDDELPTTVMPAAPTAIDGSWKKRKPSRVPEVGALRFALSFPVRFIGIRISSSLAVVKGHSSAAQGEVPGYRETAACENIGAGTERYVGVAGDFDSVVILTRLECDSTISDNVDSAAERIRP